MQIKQKYSKLLFLTSFYSFVILLSLIFGYFISGIASALEVNFQQQAYDSLYGPVSSVTLTLNCPNRDMTFNEFRFYGKHENNTSQNLQVVYQGNTVTELQTYPMPYQMVDFTLSPALQCVAGSTVDIVLSAPGSTFRYRAEQPDSSVYPTTFADTKIYISGNTENLLSGGLTEFIEDSVTPTSTPIITIPQEITDSVIAQTLLNYFSFALFSVFGLLALFSLRRYAS